MLIKSLNFNVCVCTFIGGEKEGGGCRGSFTNRAVVVTESFSLTNLNFKQLKQKSIPGLQLLIFVVATRCNFCCP